MRKERPTLLIVEARRGRQERGPGMCYLGAFNYCSLCTG